MIQAKEFIQSISGSYNGEEVFFCFPDEEGGPPPQTHVGKFSDLLPALEDANSRGLAVCMTVNRTDLRGRKRENMTGVRAFFVDKDDGPLPETITSKLPPSLVIKTKHGFHAYWLAEEGTSFEDFEKVEKLLVRAAQADESVKDVTRVMRLPGFKHQKDAHDPFDVELLEKRDIKYSAAAIIKALEEEVEETPRPSSDEPEQEVDNLSLFKEFAEGLHPSKGSSNTSLIRLCREGLALNVSELELHSAMTIHLRKIGKDADLGQILKSQKAAHAKKPFVSHAKSMGNIPYVVNSGGVWAVRPKSTVWLADPVQIVARSRSEASGDWGLTVEFEDGDEFAHRLAISNRDISSQPEMVFTQLMELGYGISTSPSARSQFCDFLLRYPCSDRGLAVSRPGWIRNFSAYVFPNETIGDPAERVIYQPGNAPKIKFEKNGSLACWNDKIGKFAIDNSRLQISILTALAPILLRPLSYENFGLHLRGMSSAGKTIAQLVAASVWGQPKQILQRWRATDNGLEILASQYNDALLVLDEIGQVDPRKAGEISYMLGNGQGKVRATKFLGVREPAQFSLTFLSSGELSLEQIMREGGKAIRAGQEVRMIDVSADAQRGYGIFENLHGHSSSQELAEYLRLSAQDEYGSVAREMISRLIEDFEGLVKTTKDFQEDFGSQLVSEGMDGQVKRVAMKFAFLGSIGELASYLGVLTWPSGSALNAAKTIFNSWVTERGTTSESEAHKGIKHLRSFIVANMGRFVAFKRGPGGVLEADGKLFETKESLGFRRVFVDSKGNPIGTDWLISPEAFRNDIFHDCDYRPIQIELRKQNFLKMGHGGSYTTPEKIPYHPPRSMRFYVISDRLFSEEDDSDGLL